MVKVRLNQDKNFVEEFKKTLSDNDGYCPCRIEKTESYTLPENFGFVAQDEIKQKK